MKINTTTKKFTTVELTWTDVKNGLKNYQVSQLADMAANHKSYSPNSQAELFWNFLQGDDTEWFDNICESNSLYWIYTPASDDWASWVGLIEQFPNVFIHDASNVLKGCTADSLIVKFNEHDVDSQTLLNNI